MQILLVEDDEVLGRSLKKALQAEGYPVDWVKDGNEGIESGLIHPYGLAILDLMLPGANGYQICRAFRKAGMGYPILMLTARDAVEDVVKGLDQGADDYLVKPFAFPELMARIRALTRRDASRKDTVIEIAGMRIDTLANSLAIDGQPVELTRREFSLLTALARNPERTLTRDMILEAVWNNEESLPNSVNFHVSCLRRKVGAERIETIHGVGYRLRTSQP